VGGMTPARQDAARDLFQSGEVRVIFITAAGAESITLHRADTIYFIQPDPSFRSREQKISRIDRIGQKNAVRVVYAITPGTVDERLYELGNEKEERAEQVTRDADLMAWILGKDQDHVKSQAPHQAPPPQEQLPYPAGPAGPAQE
jgi:SNF2 family DNA or RNA helicase